MQQILLLHLRQLLPITVFEFRLACQDPSGNTTNGVIRRQTNRNNFTYIPISATNLSPNETAMGIKMTSISGSDPWPTDRYLNIWVADFSDGTLRYATFPADFATNPKDKHLCR